MNTPQLFCLQPFIAYSLLLTITIFTPHNVTAQQDGLIEDPPHYTEFSSGLDDDQYVFSSCDADVLNVSTGWDHQNGMAIGIGQENVYWVIIDDPEASTVEPRVTYAIDVYRGWADHLPGSRWIADRRSGSNSANGDYVYELRFCVSEIPENLRLVIDVLIDDLGYVEVNGTEVGRTRDSYAFRSPALHIDKEIGNLVTIGENRLTVVAQNRGSVAAGFDVAGHIIGSEEGIFRCAGVEVSEDIKLCIGKSTELWARGGVSYRWSPGDGLSCTDCPNPIASPSQTTMYHLHTTDVNGCLGVDSVLVSVENCQNDSLFTLHLIPSCVGQIERISIPFNSRDYTDTIVAVQFTGAGAKTTELDVPLPIVIRPTTDMVIPVVYRWTEEGEQLTFMHLQTASGKVYLIGIKATAKNSTSPVFNVNAIHVGSQSTDIDTCITFTNLQSRNITISDTTWIRTGRQFDLNVPKLPFTVGAGRSIELCFSFSPVPGLNEAETLLLGGTEAVNFCPHCYYHELTLDTESGIPSTLSIDAINRTVDGLHIVQVLPNPANNEVQFVFELDRVEALTVDMYTIDGEQVQTLMEKRFQAGVHILPIDVSSFPSGVYRVVLSSENSFETSTLVIVH